jgi:hypothetical protein
MTEAEINHAIATQINGWTHVEGIVYQDSDGNYCYMADYCNSIAHALDLAKANLISLKPVQAGWEASKMSNPSVSATDTVAAKSICLCLLA